MRRPRKGRDERISVRAGRLREVFTPSMQEALNSVVDASRRSRPLRVLRAEAALTGLILGSSAPSPPLVFVAADDAAPNGWWLAGTPAGGALPCLQTWALPYRRARADTPPLRLDLMLHPAPIFK